jgi:hypothetical protein
MIILRVAIFGVLILVTGCVTAEKFGELEKRVKDLESLGQKLALYAGQETACYHPGKKQKSECSYRLKVFNIDKTQKTADGTIPDDVIDFHAQECARHTNGVDLPKDYYCPEYADFRGLRFHFSIDPFPDDLTENQIYNFLNNRGQRSLKLDTDQTAPPVMKRQQSS